MNKTNILFPVTYLLLVAWLGAGLLVREGYAPDRMEAMMDFLWTFQYDVPLLVISDDILAAGVVLVAKYMGFLLLGLTGFFVDDKRDDVPLSKEDTMKGMG